MTFGRCVSGVLGDTGGGLVDPPDTRLHTAGEEARAWQSQGIQTRGLRALYKSKQMRLSLRLNLEFIWLYSNVLLT